MRLTNNNNYPDAIVRAAKAHLYEPSKDINRVTELISPPLIKTLTIENWDNIVVDVDDEIVALFGTAFHELLSSYEKKDGVIFKQRFNIKIDGNVISGEPDKFVVDSGILSDYKVTSAWTMVFGRAEWEQQLNIYKFLLEKHGYTVNKAFINAFLRDWTKYQAIQKGNWDYPQQRYVIKRINLWDNENIENFIKERLNDHLNNPRRECTAEEKWEKKATYAVVKEGRKTALRVLDSMGEAKEWLSQQKDTKKLSITERKGACTRCEQYCSVNKFCPYYKGE